MRGVVIVSDGIGSVGPVGGFLMLPEIGGFSGDKLSVLPDTTLCLVRLGDSTLCTTRDDFRSWLSECQVVFSEWDRRMELEKCRG